MEKKAELLQGVAEELRAHLDAANLGIPLFRNMEFTLEELRALVEALESLRWVNLYDNLKNQRILGNEHTAYNEAITIGFKRNSTDINYIETVGIIRLKDSQQ
ncbi:MAG: hypothetical protein IPN33_24975 [Saprospiraceae bacterium]|nr:hypothetical protein [Saprospiraceae bacterium]